MKIRFIEHKKEIFVVIGITYGGDIPQVMCYTAIPLQKNNNSIFRALTNKHSINIPFTEAEEITDKNKLLLLMLLYG